MAIVGSPPGPVARASQKDAPGDSASHSPLAPRSARENRTVLPTHRKFSGVYAPGAGAGR